jgi:hypothetical protein
LPLRGCPALATLAFRPSPSSTRSNRFLRKARGAPPRLFDYCSKQIPKGKKDESLTSIMRAAVAMRLNVISRLHGVPLRQGQKTRPRREKPWGRPLQHSRTPGTRIRQVHSAVPYFLVWSRHKTRSLPLGLTASFCFSACRGEPPQVSPTKGFQHSYPRYFGPAKKMPAETICNGADTQRN